MGGPPVWSRWYSRRELAPPQPTTGRNRPPIPGWPRRRLACLACETRALGAHRTPSPGVIFMTAIQDASLPSVMGEDGAIFI